MLAIYDFANGRTPTFLVPSNVSQFVWTPDGSAVVFAGPRALRVDVRSGAESDLGDASWDLALSPDGRRLAYSSGGNCGDRTGIYVRTIGSREARRITNDCHV